MDPKTNFALIVIQTELERYKFLTRSYLRARMAKVNHQLLIELLLRPNADTETPDRQAYPLLPVQR